MASSRVHSIERSLNAGVSTRELDRDDVGRFLVIALAAELEPGLGIVVPNFPVSAPDILSHMNGFVEVPGRTVKRAWRYQIPHPGVVFWGIVNAKTAAMETVNQIVSANWGGDTAGYLAEKAKVRAAQALVDFLHFKEGKKSCPFWLGAGFVAMDIIVERCLAYAEENGIRLDNIRVRESAQFPADELMEHLHGEIRVVALGGKMDYTYHLPHPGSVRSMVEQYMCVATGEKPHSAKDAVESKIANMTEVEKEVFAFVANDLISDLAAMGNGNGHTDVAKPAAKTDSATEPVTDDPVATDDVDPDQQAEDERLAAEIDAELRAREAGLDAADPTSDEVETMCAEQADHMAGLVADATIEPTSAELRTAEQLAAQTEQTAGERIPLVGAAQAPANGKPRKRKTAATA